MTSISTPIAGSTPSPRAFTLHRFLLRHAFYPLLLCTMLALAFLGARIYHSRSWSYRFLVWNLFLAWIPYHFSLIAAYLHERRSPRRWLRIAVGCAWLVMLPNAPYILTDFIHLFEIQPMRWWYDLGMMITFALAGCFLGVVSLRIMHEIVRPRLGFVGSWVFVTACTLLSGFGIYLGRFQRWNSWDLLTRPSELADQIFGGFTTHSYSHTRPLGVTLMFGAMMLVTYIMFVSTATPPVENPRE